MEVLVWIFTVPEKIFFFFFNLTMWVALGYFISDEVRKRL